MQLYKINDEKLQAEAARDAALARLAALAAAEGGENREAAAGAVCSQPGEAVAIEELAMLRWENASLSQELASSSLWRANSKEAAAALAPNSSMQHRACASVAEASPPCSGDASSPSASRSSLVSIQSKSTASQQAAAVSKQQQPKTVGGAGGPPVPPASWGEHGAAVQAYCSQAWNEATKGTGGKEP